MPLVSKYITHYYDYTYACGVEYILYINYNLRQTRQTNAAWQNSPRLQAQQHEVIHMCEYIDGWM